MKELNKKNLSIKGNSIIVCSIGSEFAGYKQDSIGLYFENALEEVLNKGINVRDEEEKRWIGYINVTDSFRFKYIIEKVLKYLITKGIKIKDLLELIPKQDLKIKFKKQVKNPKFWYKLEFKNDGLVEDLLKNTDLILFRRRKLNKIVIIDNVEDLRFALTDENDIITVFELKYELKDDE